ncbi:hypothetical protein IP88_13500 [alpha proteobacterium AAP81b]|nr:hypothetical protein IP88_13500 [alpha proteobacterium AAP81b]
MTFPRLPPHRLVLIGIAISLAIGIGFGLVPRQLRPDEAMAIGDRVMASYRRGNGEPAWRFGPRETTAWADGWEMRWRYRPCAAMASLRVVVSRDGSRVRVAEFPDCAPPRGFGALPLKV